ncbi:MAG: LysR family transcriptional regulator [Firmicutes bacterium]|nr:LysR family transcriptional regulator [Bacillota bacterium]
MKLDLNINAIQNFVTVADMGNITNAAEQLFITQPTLSRQLAAIEEMLSTKLFDRKKFGVTLTPEGNAFYQQCRKLMKAYEEFESHAMGFQSLVTGTLNIAYQKASEDLMMFLNSDFLRTYPNVTITNYRQASTNLLNLLGRNDLDLALMYGNEVEQSTHAVRSIQVGELPNVLMVSRQNPLAERKSVHIAELKDENFVLPSKSNSPRRSDQIVETCRKAGYMPQVAAVAINMVDFIMDVVRYDGVAIMPLIPSLESNQHVKFIELEGYPEKTYPIHLVWNPANTSPLLQTYIDFAENYVYNMAHAKGPRS